MRPGETPKRQRAWREAKPLNWVLGDEEVRAFSIRIYTNQQLTSVWRCRCASALCTSSYALWGADAAQFNPQFLTPIGRAGSTLPLPKIDRNWRFLSPSTGLQPAFCDETVEADASAVTKGGTAARWSLGRHAASPGWTPVSTSGPRPNHPPTLHGSANGRATRMTNALPSCLWLLAGLSLDGCRHPGCPPAFSGWGGADAPTAEPGCGQPCFRWGENFLAAPPAARRPCGHGAACRAVAERLAPRLSARLWHRT